jgi:hypothetical protein
MTTDNNQPPFSETALDFTAATAKVSLADSDSWAFGYEDFTIESWVYCTDLLDDNEGGDYLDDKAIFGSMANLNKQQFLFYIRHTGHLGFWDGNDAVGRSTYDDNRGRLENETWHHVALVRRNLRIYMYVDGQLVYTGCNAVEYKQTNGFSVGAVYDPYLSTGPGWSRHFNGQMQDFRVTKGHAVYTSDFVLAKSLLNKCSAEERCPPEVVSPPTPIAQPTPTPIVNGTISPRLWTSDEVTSIFENSSETPPPQSSFNINACTLSMYVKDGKYYIASGPNNVGEPATFKQTPTIEWNYCDECVCREGDCFGDDFTFPERGFLVFFIYESEEAANLACEDSTGICTRKTGESSKTIPDDGSAEIRMAATPDGTHHIADTMSNTFNQTYGVFGPESGTMLTNHIVGAATLHFHWNLSEITEPTTLYYYDKNTPNMGGEIKIIPCVSTPTPTPAVTPTSQANECETCDTDMSTIAGLSTWSSVQGIADTTTGQEIPTYSGTWEWPWQKNHPHLNIPYDESSNLDGSYYSNYTPAGSQAFISGDGSTVMLSHPATDDSNLTNAGVIQLWKHENNLWNLSTHLMGTQGNAAELTSTRDGYLVRNYFGSLAAMDTSGKIVITEFGDPTTDNVGSTYQLGSYVYDESADTWTASQSVTISPVNALMYDQPGVTYGPFSRLTSNSCCTRFACSWLTKIGDQRYIDINICDRTDLQNGQSSWASTAQFSIDISRDLTGLYGDDLGADVLSSTYNYKMKMSGDGNTLVVSEHRGTLTNQGSSATHDDTATRTRVYRKATSSNTWSQIGSALVTPSPMDNFGFDADVSSDGDTIIVGAPGNHEDFWGDMNQNSDKGTHGNRRGFARVYKYNSTNWVQDAEFIDPDTSIQAGIQDEFATAVAVNCSGDMIAISNTAEQKFMIYRRESGNWILHSELVPDWSQTNGSYSQMFYPDQVSFSEDGTHVILKLGYATTASEHSRQIRVLKLT